MKNLYFIILIALSALSTYAQVVYIPDPAFKAYALANHAINTNGDTSIQVSEAAAYTGELYLDGINIFDTTGMGAFPNITGFHADQNAVGSYLNLSSRTSLKSVWIMEANLKGLDLSNDTALTTLQCSGNFLTSLNLYGCRALTHVDCNQNFLSSLDMSPCSALTYLYCTSNNLITLNVRNGNNINMGGNSFHAEDNTNLFCIEVDSVAYSNANWAHKDSQASYSTDCSPAFVSETAAGKDVTIYPNPVTTELIIETDWQKGVNVKLYNAFGQMVKDHNIYMSRETIDLSHVAAGIYWVQITDDRNTISKKIIKQ